MLNFRPYNACAVYSNTSINVAMNKIGYILLLTLIKTIHWDQVQIEKNT